MKFRDRFDSSIFNLLIKLIQVKRAENFSVMQIEAIQQKRFKKLLKHVIKHSEFYREYYKEHGVNLEKLDDVKLEDLPIISKEIMMDNFDSLVCDNRLKKSELDQYIIDASTAGKLYKDKFRILHTSGSSGKVGIFVYGPNDWITIKSAVISRVSKYKIKVFKKTKLSFFGVIDGHYAGISLKSDAPKFLFDFLPVDINRPIEESVEKLNHFMPDYISGYSSGIHFLALQQLKGTLNISPTRVICSADPLTKSMSNDIFKAFKVMPTNFYASTESLAMAVQCDNTDEGLSLFTDLHIFEVLKHDGEPAGLNEAGNIVLTNLYNYTQPIIRYKMDDEITLDEKESTCGWPFPLIKTVSGREEEILWFNKNDGTELFIHPTAFIDFLVEGLEKLQVVELYDNYLQFNVIVRKDQEKVIKTIMSGIDDIISRNNLSGIVEYRINIVYDIPNDPVTGKFRIVVPLKS